mgnify:CR=1 FL=1
MSDLTHLTPDGAARMVDVGGKPVTERRAEASGRITMSSAAAAAIAQGTAQKGDVLAVARVAGIMAAKRTSELIPLCHPLPLNSVTIDLAPDANGVTVTARCACTGTTGVEMEAMTAVSVALLTIYDMAKAIDKAMTISAISLQRKTGGKSGDWTRPA